MKVLAGGMRRNSTVARVAKLLTAVGHRRPGEGVSLRDISDETGVHKATAFRLLNSLEHNGFIEKWPNGRFRIGPTLIELVSAYLDDLEVVDHAHTVLERLAAQTGETVHLAIPSASEVVYVDKVESSQSLRMVSRIGTRNPLHCTALGKAILAHAGEDQISRMVTDGLAARTKNTLATDEALRADLAVVKSRGYATDREENKSGICCVGAEIRDRRGRVVAAISVSGPSVRMDETVQAQAGSMVRHAADEISRRLGYQPVRTTP